MYLYLLAFNRLFFFKILLPFNFHRPQAILFENPLKYPKCPSFSDASFT